MKIVSFNANSIRARVHQLEALVETQSPDIIGIQETKATDEDFPIDIVRDLGYEAIYFGQKTHYGVALLSRYPFLEKQYGFPEELKDAQRRMVAGVFDIGMELPLTVINGYFPQGENRDHPLKFPAKRKYYQDLTNYLNSRCSTDAPVLVVGDMNISPQDIDIGIGESNRKRWLRDGKCSFLPEERQWLENIYNWGLIDTFRAQHPKTGDVFSWFDYRSRGFEREPKRGLRIDLILATQILAERCIQTGVDYNIRSMERPSDHAPIWAEFRLD
ncbi:MAG: exodeoxyribonuclease III [Gammaproteobacteria bacterium]|nr:exodeoxyribonuclease III [Gammaproteobacteria bacterium]